LREISDGQTDGRTDGMQRFMRPHREGRIIYGKTDHAGASETNEPNDVHQNRLLSDKILRIMRDVALHDGN